MNIGFDLDKIFIDYPPFIPASLIDRIYRKKLNGALLYRIPNRPEQLIRRISHLPILRPKIKKNLLFLTEIVKNKNNKHYLISSRFGFLKQRTNAVVKKYKLDKLFTGIYFNFDNKQPHEFKDAKIKQLKINRYVDDDLNTLKHLAKKNKNTLFFWLNPKINKKLTKNLIAIKDIEQILA